MSILAHTEVYLRVCHESYNLKVHLTTSRTVVLINNMIKMEWLPASANEYFREQEDMTCGYVRVHTFGLYNRMENVLSE